MGWWAERVVPFISEKGCGTQEIGSLRERQCRELRGDVIELGFGSGHSLAFLPPEVITLHAVEPSQRARRYAETRIAASTVAVEYVGTDAQALDVADNRYDHALSTFTLCTIPDVSAALSEVRRVLRPGGKFHFVEHGRAPDPRAARFQRRWDRIQTRVLDGCHVSRPIADLIEDAGFTVERLDNSALNGPKSLAYIYEGVAVPAR